MALLGVGWADAALGEFKRALVPWLALRKRNLLDSAVQESYPDRAVCVQSAGGDRPGRGVLQLRDRFVRCRDEADRRVDRADPQRRPARPAAEGRQEGHAHLVLAAEDAARRAGVALSVSAARQQRIPGGPQELPRAQVHEPQPRRLARDVVGLRRHARYASGSLRRARAESRRRDGGHRSRCAHAEARGLRVAHQRDREVQRRGGARHPRRAAHLGAPASASRITWRRIRTIRTSPRCARSIASDEGRHVLAAVGELQGAAVERAPLGQGTRGAPQGDAEARRAGQGRRGPACRPTPAPLRRGSRRCARASTRCSSACEVSGAAEPVSAGSRDPRTRTPEAAHRDLSGSGALRIGRDLRPSR